MLFCVIAFVTVVTVTTLILATFNRSKDEIPAEVAELSDTWKTINHPTYGVSFGVPVDWKIKVFESGIGPVSGFFSGDTTVVYLDINVNTDISNPKVEDLLESVSPYIGEEINQEGLKGISYVGKAREEGSYNEDESVQGEISEVQFSDKSYVAGMNLIVKPGILEAECMVIGPDYAVYISVCDKVLKSIEKI